MHQATFDVDAASSLFNLPGYGVVSASPAVGDQLRQGLIEAVEAEGVSGLRSVVLPVQARPTQHVKDVACGGGRLDVVVCERRHACWAGV